jgi:predicted outer membrane repeat protein
MTARGKMLLARIGVAVLLLGLLPQAQLAYADTYTVTTTQDAPHALPIDGTCTSTLPGGTCTLRAAVQAINYLTGGPHTINLQAAGTYLLTVTGANEDVAATGDLDLNNAQVTIANTSGGSVAIDGNQADRVFDVGPNGPAQLSISGVVIQHGVASYVSTGPPPVAQGGGLYLHGSSRATLTGVQVSGNVIPPSPILNSTSYGGGIYNAGVLALADVVLSGNAAQAGGGLYTTYAPAFYGVNTTLARVTLTANSATQSGGGIYVDGTGVAMDNITVNGNSGGGLFFIGGGTLSNSAISNNHGGITISGG